MSRVTLPQVDTGTNHRRTPTSNISPIQIPSTSSNYPNRLPPRPLDHNYGLHRESSPLIFPTRSASASASSDSTSSETDTIETPPTLPPWITPEEYAEEEYITNSDAHLYAFQERPRSPKFVRKSKRAYRARRSQAVHGRRYGTIEQPALMPERHACGVRRGRCRFCDEHVEGNARREVGAVLGSVLLAVVVVVDLGRLIWHVEGNRQIDGYVWEMVGVLFVALVGLMGCVAWFCRAKF